MTGDDIWKFIIAYAGGIVTTIAVFRSRFTQIDSRFQEEARVRAMERQHDKEMLDVTLTQLRASIKRTRVTMRRMEQRQLVTQELTASIAVKLGVTHRALGVDALARAESENDNDVG